MNHHDRCQACGTARPEWTPQYREAGIYRCGHCRSLTFFPSGKLELAALYSPRYFSGGEYTDYVGHRAVHELNFRRKWRLIRRFAPAPLRVFEIGCAYGYFVNCALQSGAEQAFGVDVSEEAVAAARREFGPIFETASATATPPFSYNCLVGWDVWEHLEHPLDLFASHISGLTPGGLVCLTTVDASAAVARLRGRRWRQLHPPTHVHYPTKKGLAEGLRSLGLEILHHGHFGYYRALASYLAPLKMDGLVTPFKALRNFPVPLDLRDIQIVVAVKPDHGRDSTTVPARPYDAQTPSP